MPKEADPAGDESLKRLGGGRWQTRDERFTIEPQSGRWVVVDGEQTDDLGLPLVRGPFPSLTAAKTAISAARSSEPAESPLAGRIAGRRASKPDGTDRERPSPTTSPQVSHAPAKIASRGRAGGGPKRTEAPEPTDASGAPEPIWLAELAAAERGRARRLMARLAEAGIADAEGIVRRDVAGGVAAIAATAIERRLDALGDDARPDDIVALLAEGRDDGLEVRWRIVDADGRPIVLDRRPGGGKR